VDAREAEQTAEHAVSIGKDPRLLESRRAQKSFWSFIAAPMSPLIFSFPVM
jgi:hypothetical protein